VDIELWKQDVNLLRPIRSARERHDLRQRIFIRISEGGHYGWGEVAAQSVSVNGDASFEQVVAELRTVIAPALREAFRRDGDLPASFRAAGFISGRSSSHVAVALVEMALFDRELRRRQADISTVWPPQQVTAQQSTISLLEGGGWEVPSEAQRVRVKVRPGLVKDRFRVLQAIRKPILLDYNASADSPSDVIDDLRYVAGELEISAVEQPFEVGNLIETAKLASQISVPVSLDEGIRSLRDLDHAIRYKAASMICVKPSRVGGLTLARTLILKAQAAGLSPYIGGFFESPYGRRVLRVLADGLGVGPSDLGLVAEGGDARTELSETEYSFGVEPAERMLLSMTPISLDIRM
jgi:o-succinylbenzoate synthase